MSKNIAIDLGNTSAKLYVYDGSDMVDMRRCDTGVRETIDLLISQYGVRNAIISSVRKDDAEICNDLRLKITGKVINLTYSTPLPITIAYGSPKTLGSDRIAVAVGAQTQAPGRNLLIIDLGTALTMDVVDADGKFLGGNISLGLNSRFRALNDYTGRLPLIDANADTPLIGYDTVSAMRSGVVRGLAYEINGYISEISGKMQKIAVFITGGDSKYLAKWIKYPIFEDQNLLARGLNTILLYNIG
ncbi:MAG: type III pantothenate kinase [Muribaculaceae bacterium]|nr:type III pantothenate kinase [Muribaculaceae bacterium]